VRREDAPAHASWGELRVEHEPVDGGGRRREAVDLGSPVAEARAWSPDLQLAVAAGGLAQVLARQRPRRLLPELHQLAITSHRPDEPRHLELLEAFELARGGARVE